MRNFLTLAALLAAAAVPRPALCKGDIVFAARFYNSPRGSAGRAASRAQLFRIDADGANRRQITRGAHDDQIPQWSPDGKRISFVRDGSWICVADADGRGVKQLFGLANLPQWSPGSRELGVLDDGSHTLFFVDVRSGKRRALKGVESFAWSPDGQRLAWLGLDKKLWIVNLKTKSRTVAKLSATRLGWAGPQVLVAALEHKQGEGVDGLDTFVTLDTSGQEIKRFPIRGRLPDPEGAPEGESNLADWRSEFLPSKGAGRSFTFRWDDSTSSGRNGFYFRGNAQDGALKLLAQGQSFAWAPDGQRFAWAPYHDLAPYNVQGRRPRLVYTSPLKVGDGSTSRTLVSGLVLIYGIDWR